MTKKNKENVCKKYAKVLKYKCTKRCIKIQGGVCEEIFYSK